MTTVVVVGGGIAGASVAYELAAGAEVVLVESEATLAAHTTGRSAAMYLPSYGNAVVRALTAASRPDFDRLADELATPPLLSPRSLVWVGDEGRAQGVLDLLAADPSLAPLTTEEALELCPALRPERLGAAALDASGMDVDVAALHEGYVRGLRRRGARVVTSAPVTALARTGDGGWRVAAGDRELPADVVVDAAGAWADPVAVLAGVAPLGLRALRRTLFTSPVERPEALAGWPLVSDVDDQFYFRPEPGGVLVSPADETPSDPCDARPEPEDVALALERVGERTTLGLRSVRSAWAGLRTFAPDRSPVVGPAPGEPGFWWFAGQGGYGIQLAPALARTAASLLLDGRLPPDVAALGVTADALSPARLLPT